MLWDINLKLWYIYLVGSATHQVKSFITVESPWPTLLPRMGQSNFSSFMDQKLYTAYRFGTLRPISCSYPRHSQLTRHSLMLANGRIRQSLTPLALQWFVKLVGPSLFIPSTKRSCWGGYIGFTPSVRPSRIPCPLCSIYSSGWILSIFGTNDQ